MSATRSAAAGVLRRRHSDAGAGLPAVHSAAVARRRRDCFSSSSQGCRWPGGQALGAPGDTAGATPFAERPVPIKVPDRRRPPPWSRRAGWTCVEYAWWLSGVASTERTWPPSRTPAGAAVGLSARLRGSAQPVSCGEYQPRLRLLTAGLPQHLTDRPLPVRGDVRRRGQGQQVLLSPAVVLDLGQQVSDVLDDMRALWRQPVDDLSELPSPRSRTASISCPLEAM